MSVHWREIYHRNKDGFLYCVDFINQHQGISAEAKMQTTSAIINDLVKPSIANRVPTNPATYEAKGEPL